MSCPHHNYREMERDIHTDFKEDMSYGDYLQLGQVLTAQKPLSDQQPPQRPPARLPRHSGDRATPPNSSPDPRSGPAQHRTALKAPANRPGQRILVNPNAREPIHRPGIHRAGTEAERQPRLPSSLCATPPALRCSPRAPHPMHKDPTPQGRSERCSARRLEKPRSHQPPQRPPASSPRHSGDRATPPPSSPDPRSGPAQHRAALGAPAKHPSRSILVNLHPASPFIATERGPGRPNRGRGTAEAPFLPQRRPPRVRVRNKGPTPHASGSGPATTPCVRARRRPICVRVFSATMHPFATRFGALGLWR